MLDWQALRALVRGVLLVALVALGGALRALTFSNAYASPRNHERAVRAKTTYIILHTTEAEAKSSLRKLSKNGEAHYCVDRSGRIYRIVNRTRVAYHCGTSMWNGERNLDEVSIGIEVVGYHDRALTPAQYTALRQLITLLQKLYGIKDANVMPHAQVAYGTPNRWHPKNHRGRKRCGMGYATSGVRALLGLKERWLSDPDVRFKRLVVGDAFLAKVLYSKQGTALLPYQLPAQKPAKPAAPAKQLLTKVEQKLVEALPKETRGGIIAKGRSAWDIARDAYNAASTIYIFPNGKQMTGDKIRDWESIVAGTRVILGDPGDSVSPVLTLGAGQHPRSLVGDAATAADTWYIRPTGGRLQGSKVTAAQLAALPAETKILVGYLLGGPVSSKRLPAKICPTQWDAPDTYYQMPGKPLKPFREMDMRRVPAGTYIFYRH